MAVGRDLISFEADIIKEVSMENGIAYASVEEVFYTSLSYIDFILRHTEATAVRVPYIGTIFVNKGRATSLIRKLVHRIVRLGAKAMSEENLSFLYFLRRKVYPKIEKRKRNEPRSFVYMYAQAHFKYHKGGLTYPELEVYQKKYFDRYKPINYIQR